MDQPVGTVIGNLTMFRPDTVGGGEWWQVSRHVLKNRITFWVRNFKGRPERMVMVTEWQTDEIWGNDSADEWITSQAASKYRSGFRLIQSEGTPGPPKLNEYSSTQTTPVRTDR